MGAVRLGLHHHSPGGIEPGATEATSERGGLVQGRPVLGRVALAGIWEGMDF